MKTITYNIPDMQSSHCQLRVKKSVTSIASVGVTNVNPGEIALEFDEQKATEEEISDAIRQAGYTVAASEIKD